MKKYRTKQSTTYFTISSVTKTVRKDKRRQKVETYNLACSMYNITTNKLDELKSNVVVVRKRKVNSTETLRNDGYLKEDIVLA